MKSPKDIIKGAQKEKRTALLEHEAKGLARAVGIPVPEFRVVEPDDRQALLDAAQELEYPLALKAVSPDILHKTDAGAVMLDIKDDAYLMKAVGEMRQALSARVPKAKIRALLLERMMPPGLELLVGGLRDEQFGPSIAFGLGGVWVEALKDAVFGILPLSRQEVLDMMAQTRAGMVLQGFRGSPPLDRDAVISIISSVSAVMEENDAIQEIDMNPVRVYRSGASALDIRIIVRPAYGRE